MRHTAEKPIAPTAILRNCLLVMMLLAAGPSVGWSAEVAGTVKTLTGSATVKRNSEVVPIEIGQKIYAGDRVASAEGGYVSVMMQDDTRLTIGPRSEMLISEFQFNSNTYDGNMVVAFLKGTARVVTGLIGRQAPENVRFQTPTATIGIRGTEFVVDLGE